MTLDFVDLHTLLIIMHLFGVVIGAGGAFMSDAIFFSSIKDNKVTYTEMRFLNLGSTMVWSGLAIIIISGILLFLGNVEEYLESSKFLAKMTIVGIIIINGIIFRLVHIPLLRRNIDKHLPSSNEFMRRSSSLLISGVVSMISWISAIILGALRIIPYSYTVIILVYVTFIFIGIIVALLMKKRVIFSHRK